MIYVTHDQDEAMAPGDRVAVLDRGRLQQVDRPAALYERPANRFVAGVPGWPPIHAMDGEPVADGERLLLRLALKVALVERLGPVSPVTLAHGDWSVAARLSGACPGPSASRSRWSWPSNGRTCSTEKTGRALCHGNP
jgi:energy-coupling factor transporter ATP-binding protein EcfA2